ncbi:MAG TPA: helix-turn-helix domain-containing protein [Gaiellaceae bacterium]|nr:helix-turn-helix domain-containing protein [Gaiellaceae bacterium]
MAEAVRITGRHPQTIYRWMRSGALPAKQVVARGTWLIPVAALDALLATETNEARS